MVECYFTSTETIGLLGTGAQDVHLDFHTAPELCMEVGRDGDYIPVAILAVTTRMTSVLRWAAIRTILMFHNCEGQSQNTTTDCYTSVTDQIF